LLNDTRELMRIELIARNGATMDVADCDVTIDKGGSGRLKDVIAVSKRAQSFLLCAGALASSRRRLTRSEGFRI